jgi:hypothetical protein
MTDPVIAADGHTYEKEAIQAWLHQHSSSPVTGKALEHKYLIPNLVLKSVIANQQELRCL